MVTPDKNNDNARNVLSQEELDFLLSPQKDEESAGTNAQEPAFAANAPSRKRSTAGKNAGKNSGKNAAKDAARKNGLDRAAGDDEPDAAPSAAEGGQPAALSRDREQKRFFAVALEHSLRRATGTFVGIRFDGDKTLSSGALDELAGAPACFVEISSARGAGIVFCLDNRAAQALANASLGQGHGPARTEGPLSLFDRELVRRSLRELGEAFAQAFDCPCAACVRLAWRADGMFRAGSGKELRAAEFSMETCGQLGRAWLFAPKNAA